MTFSDEYKVKCLSFIVITAFLLYIFHLQVSPYFPLRTPEIIFIVPESPEPVEKYLIMFDAGSSGTRIHVYLFSLNANGTLTLKGEFYDKIMKSLSSFTKHPNKASHVITDLLKDAHVIIPKEKWNTTLVALKATAGFRSLPANVSTSILDEVQKTVENSSFSCAEECVSVLSGEDEGIYGWYTLNFLLGAIEKENNSVALLAVGGGSLQLSFSPADTDSISLNTEDYKILPKVHFSPVPIYSRSYLGFGTTSAKLSILEIPSNNSVVSKRKKNSKDLIELSTPCVHPLEKITYRYNSEIYRIRGDRHGKYGYKYCYKKAVDFLGDTVRVPEELKNREIYAVSAHFIDAIASTLLVYEPSGSFTVGEFVSSCRFLCELPLRTFGCLECCYIAALLQHSIGLSSEKEIKFATQISGVSTSWSLGAALNML